MHIKKILLLASLILLFLSSSQAENSRIDYIVTYKDNIWYKTDYNYNSENKIINTTIAVSPDKNNWENYTYSTITYNNGAISEVYDYCWKNNTWDLQQTQIYEYTAKKLSTYTLINGDTKKVTTNLRDLDRELEKFDKELTNVLHSQPMKYSLIQIQYSVTVLSELIKTQTEFLMWKKSDITKDVTDFGEDISITLDNPSF